MFLVVFSSPLIEFPAREVQQKSQTHLQDSFPGFTEVLSFLAKAFVVSYLPFSVFLRK